jgi:hypothetical protein
VENKEDKTETVVDKVEKESEDFVKRLDAIERKTQRIDEINSELLRMVADMLLFMDNLGKMDNWFYYSVREKIRAETCRDRHKFFELLEKNIKAINS